MDENETEDEDEDDPDGQWSEEFEEETGELLPHICVIVDKVRKINLWFRKSSNRMEVLERYTKKTPMKDIKNRWSSMLALSRASMIL